MCINAALQVPCQVTVYTCNIHEIQIRNLTQLSQLKTTIAPTCMRLFLILTRQALRILWCAETSVNGTLPQTTPDYLGGAIRQMRAWHFWK